VSKAASKTILRASYHSYRYQVSIADEAGKTGGIKERKRKKQAFRFLEVGKAARQEYSIAGIRRQMGADLLIPTQDIVGRLRLAAEETELFLLDGHPHLQGIRRRSRR
jgi:hypothetical protein